jgi:hypothetical protein
MRNVINFFFFFDKYRKTVLKHNHLVFNLNSFLEECMKKQVLRYLLAIVGVVLLIGLIASCGDNEPRFKIIESKEYNNENGQALMNALYAKHLDGKKSLSKEIADQLFITYWSDLEPILNAEMKNKLPTVGLIVVLKVDTYKSIGSCYWKKEGGWSYSGWFYNN